MYSLLENKRHILVNKLCDKALKGENHDGEILKLQEFDYFVEKYFNLKYCSIENKYCEINNT